MVPSGSDAVEVNDAVRSLTAEVKSALGSWFPGGAAPLVRVNPSVKLPEEATNAATNRSASALTSRKPNVGVRFAPDEATKYGASGSAWLTSRRPTPPVPTVAKTVPAPATSVDPPAATQSAS